MGALAGHRILIVEDEMLVGMEFEALLQQEECATLGPAPTVARALALLEEQQPDAALLDLNLHGQPASEVARALSARGVPFVLVTGYGAAQSSAPELSHAPRVEKPVNHRELVSALTRLLDTGFG